MNDSFEIIINKDDFNKLLRSHLNIYYGQVVDKELIDQLTRYVIDSIALYLSAKD
jgi:hypothetical protein